MSTLNSSLCGSSIAPKDILKPQGGEESTRSPQVENYET